MNLYVLSGRVCNEIDFKFIYDANKKSLGKTHISIVKVMLELDNKQIVELYAYNEMADFFYKNIRKSDYILVEGKIRDNFVEVQDVYIL